MQVSIKPFLFTSNFSCHFIVDVSYTLLVCQTLGISCDNALVIEICVESVFEVDATDPILEGLLEGGVHHLVADRGELVLGGLEVSQILIRVGRSLHLPLGRHVELRLVVPDENFRFEGAVSFRKLPEEGRDVGALLRKVCDEAFYVSVFDDEVLLVLLLAQLVAEFRNPLRGLGVKPKC